MTWIIILLVLYSCTAALCHSKDTANPDGNHVDDKTDWSASQFKLINDCGIRSPFYIDNPEGVGKFPWLAKLLYTYPKVSDCGGALITDKFVLTSKACLLKEHLVAVLLGHYDTTKDWNRISIGPSDHAKRLTIRRTVLHPTSNIGLIRLSEPVAFKSWLHPICLPWNNGILPRNISGEVAGWSHLNQGTQNLNNSILHNHTVTVMPKHNCGEELKSDDICANTRSSSVDTCRGMPGGPLMVKKENKVFDTYYTIGIQTNESYFCDLHYPITYTNVGLHIDWILDQLEPIFDV